MEYGLNMVRTPLRTNQHTPAPRVLHVQIHLRCPVVFCIYRFNRMPFIHVNRPSDAQHDGVEQVVE